MAAAIPADDIKMQTPSWSSPPDEQSLSQNQNSHSSLPAEDRDSVQEPENPDFTRGSSVGDLSMSGNKSDTFRDNKQVKVLRSFPPPSSLPVVLHTALVPLPLLCAGCTFPLSIPVVFHPVACLIKKTWQSRAEIFISAHLGAASQHVSLVPSLLCLIIPPTLCVTLELGVYTSVLAAE